MDSIVQTGSTKADIGTALVSLSFSSPEKEQVVLLLQLPVSEQDARTMEDECTAIVQQSLLGSEGEPWHRLDGTLKEFNGLFKGLLLSKTMDEIHAIVALLDKTGTLHVSHAGRGEGYLIRGGLTSQITEFSKGKPLSAFVHISSGALEPGDTVIFATQRLLRTLTPAQLSNLSQSDGEFLDEVVSNLEAEREMAALATLSLPSEGRSAASLSQKSRTPVMSPRRADRSSSKSRIPFLSSLPPFSMPSLSGVGEKMKDLLGSLGKAGQKGVELGKKGLPGLGSASSKFTSSIETFKEKATDFLADLKHPERKRRAHLLLLAGAVAAFLLIWLIVSLSTSSQRNTTRTELQQLVTQVNDELKTADNLKMAGDMDAANQILQRAQESAKQVLDNQSGLFRSDALDLLDRIRQKQEDINNIVRVSPRVMVNMSSKDSGITAQGLIGLGDGEFVVYDRQNAYPILLNKLDDPKRIVDTEFILQGTYFDRVKAEVFLTTGSSVIESNASQLTTMKTEDPAGWITGKAAKTYLRFLYVLSTDKKQIYKYERLSNRYGAPVEYNVNGDLTGAVDLAIDGSVYVLKEGGTLIKLLRGETQPFAIQHAPEGILKTATKIFKLPDGNFYFLDPVKNRIIVTTDGGATGESSYSKQYVLEGDQLGTLQDLYVDPGENHIYVMDDKRVYIVDIGAR